MTERDFIIGAIFTTDGNDIWKLKSYCMSPTCELENVETGKRESFGIGGLTARTFKRVELKEVV